MTLRDFANRGGDRRFSPSEKLSPGLSPSLDFRHKKSTSISRKCLI